VQIQYTSTYYKLQLVLTKRLQNRRLSLARPFALMSKSAAQRSTCTEWQSTRATSAPWRLHRHASTALPHARHLVNTLLYLSTVHTWSTAGSYRRPTRRVDPTVRRKACAATLVCFSVNFPKSFLHFKFNVRFKHRARQLALHFVYDCNAGAWHTRGAYIPWFIVGQKNGVRPGQGTGGGRKEKGEGSGGTARKGK